MKEKFNIIADNLHLKGWTKYLALAIFFIIVLFVASKLLSFKPAKDNKQDIVFKLNGSKVVTIYEYDEITDEGVTATDEYGKDISSKVIKIGNVDTSKTGIYDVTYKLNTNGTELRLERTYVVIANEGAYIELMGNKIINLGLGSKYVEPGYVAVDYVNGEVTDKVEVTNNINTSIPGEYQVIYSFKGSDDEIKTATRIVRVHDILPDSLKLELLGNTNIDLLLGTPYKEPGYKATDDEEGDITDKVIIEGQVDTNKKGVYIIKYTVTNSVGIQKTQSRVVKVYEKQEGILSFALNGYEEMKIEEGKTYTEPGYMAIDSVDGNITNKVNVSGNVNTNRVGTYTITYTVTNTSGVTKTLTRKVIVQAKKTGTITFTLLGDNPMLIENGATYTEPGYRVFDTIDGNIINKVRVEGKVNTNLPGTYNITYTITNSTGITKTLTRKVLVASDITIKLTNQTKEYNSRSVDILVEISGEGFKELRLPDGTIINATKTIFKATENREYVFKAYNKSNREFTNSIKITNIDVEGPTGSCTATVNADKTKTTIKVNAIDNQSGMKNYQYIVDGYSTSQTSQSNYTYNSSSKEVYVNLFDNAGNKNKIKCNLIEEKKESTGGNSGNNNTKGSSSSVDNRKGKVTGYWIYTPDNYKVKKNALLVFLHGSGQRGNDISKLQNYAFGRYTKEGKKYNAVILMPQMKGDGWSNEQAMTELKKLIDEIVVKYNIDTRKISISGHSLGGIGTYAVIARYPNFFSAAAPISGRYPTSYAQKLSSTPIWAIHGALDTRVLYEPDLELINKIKSFGGNAQMTTLQRYGHGIVDKALLETDVVNWLITSRR